MDRLFPYKRPVGFRKCSPFVLSLIFICGAPHASAQAGDKRIEDIRRAYRETNERIAAAERNFSESEIFLTELVVNKGGTMYPAVGTFRHTIKFYYAYGDREQNPYPNRLLKITVSTDRAANREWSEYLFDPAGRLIFYYEKKGEGRGAERRYYFASGRLVGLMVGQQNAALNDREALAAARAALNKKDKLTDIFRKTLGF